MFIVFLMGPSAKVLVTDVVKERSTGVDVTEHGLTSIPTWACGEPQDHIKSV